MKIKITKQNSCTFRLHFFIFVNNLKLLYWKKLIGLTCWGHFVVNECTTIKKLIATTPIIVARCMKVTSFNGRSLSHFIL
uniref:Uncharacterized protein n=1 Tax=Cannabis sativa TaxID=3483 RepID=A0A803R445_CANSA